MLEAAADQIRVLIVEDDPDQVMLYLAKLSIEGIEATATDNEQEAMQYLLGGGFDIVLLDILLEGNEQGTKILESIKNNEKTKHIPVVMFTNYTKKETMNKAKALGAIDFVVKADSTPKLIAQRIREIVAASRKLK